MSRAELTTFVCALGHADPRPAALEAQDALLRVMFLQSIGGLDLAARETRELVYRGAIPERAALWLALDAAELRLGGALAVTAPPVSEDPFTATLYPWGESARTALRVVPGHKRGYYWLEAQGPPAGAGEQLELYSASLAAVREIRLQLVAHLGWKMETRVPPRR